MQPILETSGLRTSSDYFRPDFLLSGKIPAMHLSERPQFLKSSAPMTLPH